MIQKILFFFFFSALVIAQNQPDNDFKRLERLCQKNSNNVDSLSLYSNRLLQFGKKNNNIEAILEGYFFYSQLETLKGNKKQAIVYLDSALVYQDRTQDYSRLFRIKRVKAITCAQLGEYDIAEKIYSGIVEDATKTNRVDEIAQTYNGLGIIERNKSNYSKALQYFEKALHIWDSLGVDNAKLGAISNIGLTQKSLGNISESNKSFHKAIYLSKNDKRNESSLYRMYSNLASNFISLKKADSANYYLDKVVHYYKRTNQKFLLSLTYLNVGQSKLLTNDFKSAFWHLNTSLQEIKKAKHIPQQIENYRLLATVFYKQNDFEKALTYLDSAHTLSVDKNINYDLESQYALYAAINEKSANYKEANNYLRKNDSLKKAKYLKKTANSFNQILVLEDNKEKSNTIVKLDKEKSFYKSNLFVAVILAIILLIMFFFLAKKYLMQMKEVKELQDELEQYNIEDSEVPKTEIVIQLKSKAIINTSKILYIKSDGHYAEIFLEDKEKPEIERSSLSSLAEQLPSKDFIRIHKSYIVNIHKIKIINSTQLMVSNGEWIKLSRTYKQELKNILHKE